MKSSLLALALFAPVLMAETKPVNFSWQVEAVYEVPEGFEGLGFTYSGDVLAAYTQVAFNDEHDFMLFSNGDIKRVDLERWPNGLMLSRTSPYAYLDIGGKFVVLNYLTLELNGYESGGDASPIRLSPDGYFLYKPGAFIELPNETGEFNLYRTYSGAMNAAIEINGTHLLYAGGQHHLHHRSDVSILQYRNSADSKEVTASLPLVGHWQDDSWFSKANVVDATFINGQDSLVAISTDDKELLLWDFKAESVSEVTLNGAFPYDIFSYSHQQHDYLVGMAYNQIYWWTINEKKQLELAKICRLPEVMGAHHEISYDGNLMLYGVPDPRTNPVQDTSANFVLLDISGDGCRVVREFDKQTRKVILSPTKPILAAVTEGETITVESYKPAALGQP